MVKFIHSLRLYFLNCSGEPACSLISFNLFIEADRGKTEAVELYRCEITIKLTQP